MTKSFRSAGLSNCIRQEVSIVSAALALYVTSSQSFEKFAIDLQNVVSNVYCIVVVPRFDFRVASPALCAMIGATYADITMCFV